MDGDALFEKTNMIQDDMKAYIYPTRIDNIFQTDFLDEF